MNSYLLFAHLDFSFTCTLLLPFNWFAGFDFIVIECIKGGCDAL